MDEYTLKRVGVLLGICRMGDESEYEEKLIDAIIKEIRRLQMVESKLRELRDLLNRE